MVVQCLMMSLGADSFSTKNRYIMSDRRADIFGFLFVRQCKSVKIMSYEKVVISVYI